MKTTESIHTLAARSNKLFDKIVYIMLSIICVVIGNFFCSSLTLVFPFLCFAISLGFQKICNAFTKFTLFCSQLQVQVHYLLIIYCFKYICKYIIEMSTFSSSYYYL